MTRAATTRLRLAMALAMTAAACSSLGCSSALAQRHILARRPLFESVRLVRQEGAVQPPAPIVRRPPPDAQLTIGARPGSAHFHPNGEHLSAWMNAHSNLSPDQQQQALSREPGFNTLPPQEQQHIRERLSQLDAMPRGQRERMLANTEAMERLNPMQREAVRSAMQEWGSLPQPDRHIVGQAFRETRGLPPAARLAVLNSRYRNLTPQAQQTLQHLMNVEPLLPPPPPIQP